MPPSQLQEQLQEPESQTKREPNELSNRQKRRRHPADFRVGSPFETEGNQDDGSPFEMEDDQDDGSLFEEEDGQGGDELHHSYRIVTIPNLKIPYHWKDEAKNVQIAIDTLEHILKSQGGSARPSKSLGFIAKIRKKFGPNPIHPDTLPGSFDGKILGFQNALRLHYTRWFKVVEIDSLIAEHFGSRFMFDDLKNYKIVRRRAMQMKQGWKHEAMLRFEKHVSNLIQKHPECDIKSSADPGILRAFFRDHFNIDEARSVFWWAHDIIDLPKSSNACRTFIFEVFIIFSVQVKLYLDDPKAYDRATLNRVWDKLGDIPRFKDLGIDGFALRPLGISSRKRKREETPLREDIFKAVEYKEGDDLGVYEDPDDV
ncbi:hypothetical protein BZA05DRAFT_433838 [Tricharina praecox]|uniref:uncharacterized protein n=1 Tax=Tricharina praecox TaxID=43433 RepID=UPI00221F2479|nr:uncharacterized protein BZA05DRAFT_433838 [Tricharina praecox]KAI5857226.1 hypothetical protein BZA05DRAFT_433838 [Tricharina praecox]